MVCSDGLAADAGTAPNGSISNSANAAAELSLFILASINDKSLTRGTRVEETASGDVTAQRSAYRDRADNYRDRHGPRMVIASNFVAELTA